MRLFQASETARNERRVDIFCLHRGEGVDWEGARFKFGAFYPGEGPPKRQAVKRWLRSTSSFFMTT